MEYLKKKEYVKPSMEEIYVNVPVLMAGSDPSDAPADSGDYPVNPWGSEGGSEF